jgi:hypothetical protein
MVAVMRLSTLFIAFVPTNKDSTARGKASDGTAGMFISADISK